MAKKKSKAARPRQAKKRGRSSTAGAKTPSVADQVPQPTAAQSAAAKKKFEQGLFARGETALAGQPLPRGATHAIVTAADGGKAVVKRKRFSFR